MSFKAEVQTGGDAWTGNRLRFAKEIDALVYVADLERRWTAVTATRVVPSDDPVNSIVRMSVDVEAIG